MKLRGILLFMMAVISANLYAQDDVKARIEFGEAETAYLDEKFEDALLHIEKAEVFLGKWSSKISYLKIEILEKITDLYDFANANTIKLNAEVEKYMTNAKKNPKDIVQEKYKVVYKVEELLKIAKSNFDDTQAPEFKKAKAAYDAKDYVTAQEWFTKASEKGNAEAMHYIGHLYYYGHGVEQDYFKAYDWSSKAANKGSAEAIQSLIYLYVIGEGVSLNLSKVLELSLKLADLGHNEGIFWLGFCHYSGYGTEKNYSKAFNQYSKASFKGNVSAMEWLANLYFSGEGTKTEYTKAMYWYLKSAEGGNPSSMNQIGVIYFKGLSVPQDYVKAIEWFKKASAGGNASSMVNMAVCYRNSLGVERNYLVAAEWYEKATEKGNIDSLKGMSEIYEAGGYGLKRNKKKAKEYLDRYEMASKNKK